MSDPKLPPYTKLCKCGYCGEYFSNVTNFDLHRRGKPESRYCVHPSKLVKGNGKARLRLSASGYWVRADGVFKGISNE